MDCGACCASFRVSFYWAEGEDGGGAVPVAMTEKVDSFHRCMRGTWSAAPRCMALQGEVGRSVACSIYAQRPSPCHAVTEGDAQCRRARARHGLPALALAPA